MAPEILLKHCYNPSADLWSIGVILYECLFGRAPYSSKTLDELLQKIKVKQKITISSTAAISSDCRDIMTRLLVHDPEQRISFQQFFDHPFLDLKHNASDEVSYFDRSLFRRDFSVFYHFNIFCYHSTPVPFTHRILQKPYKLLRKPLKRIKRRIIVKPIMHIARDYSILCHW